MRKGKTQHVFASIRITQAWAFSDEIWPLFPVPSCVLFAENAADAGKTGRIPDTVLAASGESVVTSASTLLNLARPRLSVNSANG